MSIGVQFPDRDKQPTIITEAIQSDFRYGLRELQEIVDTETQGYEFFEHSKSSITDDDLCMLERLGRDVSVRLAHGLYVRLGMLLGIEDLIAIDRGRGTKIEPVDAGLCAIGTIIGCSIGLLTDIDQVFAHNGSAGRSVPSALIRLKDVALYSTSKGGDGELIPEYEFTQEVKVPLCYGSSAPFRVTPDSVHIENTVELDEPTDNYPALISTATFRLESLEFEPIATA